MCAVPGASGKEESMRMTKKVKIIEGQNILVEINGGSIFRYK